MSLYDSVFQDLIILETDRSRVKVRKMATSKVLPSVSLPSTFSKVISTACSETQCLEPGYDKSE